MLDLISYWSRQMVGWSFPYDAQHQWPDSAVSDVSADLDYCHLTYTDVILIFPVEQLCIHTQIESAPQNLNLSCSGVPFSATIP